MHKENQLWELAGVTKPERARAEWYEPIRCTPFEALVRANHDKAYLLTDRATFLTAKNKGEIKDLVVFVEGGEVLMNSCAVVVRSDEKRESVWNLVNWLKGERAQEVIRHYGKSWGTRVPLVTPEEQEEVADNVKLIKMFPLALEKSRWDRWNILPEVALIVASTRIMLGPLVEVTSVLV